MGNLTTEDKKYRKKIKRAREAGDYELECKYIDELYAWERKNDIVDDEPDDESDDDNDEPDNDDDFAWNRQHLGNLNTQARKRLRQIKRAREAGDEELVRKLQREKYMWELKNGIYEDDSDDDDDDGDDDYPCNNQKNKHHKQESESDEGMSGWKAAGIALGALAIGGIFVAAMSSSDKDEEEEQRRRRR